MFSYKIILLALFVSAASAVPIRREVPQEHSHENILSVVRTSLNLNNPDGIVDPVFGLLGNAAAAAGLGQITDANCLQQATADQAFTNAKAANDVNGMVNALIYRALERNSGSVGATTTPCTTITAKNPEIAAISQHQDPASTNAASVNKAIVLELAQQIAAVGGNPNDALKSGTFAPGQIGDTTAKGNTCDDANDANGCINTLNLLVDDASADEISAAVSGGSSGSSAPAATSAASSDATATTTAAATPASSAASGQNLQTFQGSLGGLPPSVTVGGRGFVVSGSDDFVGEAAALGRSCDIQHNACADAANSGAGFSVSQCDQQNTQCHAATSA